MDRLQFGDYEDVDISGWGAILEMQIHCFTNVGVQFVDRLRLREDVFADASRAPELAVFINFDFDQHTMNITTPERTRLQGFWPVLPYRPALAFCAVVHSPT